MAESSGAAGAPSLNLTPEEKRVYGQLFKQADSESMGVVTGDVAVKFFEKTRLESRILGEIWQIADRENVGFLTPAGFGVVLRLIGHCQAGREPSAELALQPGPLPRFDGISVPGLAPQTTGGGQGPASPLQAQGTGGGGIRIPPLTPEKAAQFASLFERQTLGPGGMLPGDQAKQIFEKSGLSNEILGGIWQLADTEQRGALVQTEFIIAMHLLTSMKLGQMRGLPTVVPAGLYEAATRRPSAIPRQQSPTPAAPPISAIPRQLSGQAQRRTGSPLGRPPSQPQPASDWLVTAADKVHFDRFYDELDKSKRGFITGEEAVNFFSQSKLPEDSLAQIWDLADMTSSGRLTRDEFAVAMYLIRQQRSKRDGPVPVPTALPPNLIPPSMRAQLRAAQPPAAAMASPFDAPQPPPAPAPAPQPKSALDDLFGLDSSPLQPPAPIQTAMGTGGSNDPFGSNASPAPASPAKPSPTTTSFAPFVPSSSFGRTLAVHATGTSNSSGSALSRAQTLPQQAPPAHDDDLLGGGDDEASKNLSNDTAELANLSNQIGSLTNLMQESQNKRTTTQAELSQAGVQKKNFEQRLSQLRTLYEKEAKDVRGLEEQLNASRNDTKKLQTEIAMIEATYQDLQNQHRQVAAALQADQQENASLKERIRAVNAEVASIKPQIEKLKLEARQQKGLVAINKKQLATNEAERDRLKTEADELTKSNEEMARQINAASPASGSSAPAPVASPALSASSVNNPFFRRTGSADIMGAFSSSPPPAPPAQAKNFNDKAFDDVFGPSFASPGNPVTQTVAAPPFMPQHTGASTGSASSFATPATSNTPTAGRHVTSSDPPPPPESRQINSSFLPFGDTSESLTSSRQVSPPVSRMGSHIDTPVGESVGTPTALERTATGQSAATASSSQKLGGEARPTSSGSGAIFGPPSAASPQLSQARAHSDSVGGDPFSALDQAKAKEEFDSAFASFKTSHGKAATSSSPAGAADSTASGGGAGDASKAFSAFHSEFPPISELERDDESESDSDNAGFEDNFAPASPKPVAAAPAAARPQSPDTARPAGDSAKRDLTGSPVAGTSASSVSTALPSHPPPPAESSSVDSIFGGSSSTGAATMDTTRSEQLKTSSAATAAAGAGAPPPVPAKKTSSSFGSENDDALSSDFEGLEDAKEGSNADEDFANISRSALDDFNPVFDSSPPRSRSEHGGAPLTIPATSGPGLAGPAAGTLPPPFGATESSGFDFVGGSSTSLGSGSAAAGGAAVAPAAGKPAENNHDWDALFASLDEPPAPAAAAAAASIGSPAPAPGSPESPTRPAAVGRALTEEGLHDDPILKNLTGMGYARKDAVLALEKYDYNLERAANYLASQS